MLIDELTEEKQLLMSTQLTQQTVPSTLDSSLAEIDIWPQGSNEKSSKEFAVGPFSVIDLGNPDTTHVAAVLPAGTLSPTATVPPADTLAHAETLLTTQATSTSLFEPPISLTDYLQWSDLFDLNFEAWCNPLRRDIDIGDDTNPEVDTELGDYTNTLKPSMSWSTPNSNTVKDGDLLNEGPALLKHFVDNVIGAIAALPYHAKSPYKLLNFSSATQTLASLTYLNLPVSSANIANLYALLACSAYHLAHNPSGPGVSNRTFWSEIANRAQEKATCRLQMSLQSEMDGTNKAKYKDQLIALLSLLAWAVMTGDHKAARYYMVESERLLRIRGLSKRHLSRRARLLHHMYTWARIVGESTYVLHGKGNAITEQRVTALQFQSGPDARLDDFLRLEIVPDREEPDYEQLPKEHEVVLQDVHLEDPRLYHETMFLQIYGISEHWLSLLSQTTRLSNVKDSLGAKSQMQEWLKTRIKRLEDRICTFVARHTLPDGAPPKPRPTEYMLEALNSGLVIFFYRRLRDVNEWILQSHVDNVISALRRFDESMAQQNIQGVGTPWPAFISGCEASPGTRRKALQHWLEQAWWKTGLQSYSTAKDMMQMVWSARDQATDSSRSSVKNIGGKASATPAATNWVDISRERKQWVNLW
ncbi:hypothetical protein N7474_005043 [Penicillium riverlandense]|uniref:uncharacterized protein n=1 Tax=Penicillium riverlandense TaxID=1903569 RepID=UPI0025472091|nr:uncharacterized protein N7474_005043 [Penicillium riverlandense]KAJ5819452.1 hypothetical protein N7474_005043 [Penicillium riverlandense]